MPREPDDGQLSLGFGREPAPPSGDATGPPTADQAARPADLGVGADADASLADPREAAGKDVSPANLGTGADAETNPANLGAGADKEVGTRADLGAGARGTDDEPVQGVASPPGRADTPTDHRPAPPALDRPDRPPVPHPDLADAPALVRSLARVSARYPLERKVLVCGSGGEGRELLRQLALRTGSWVGFEATTTRMLAITVAGPALAARAIRLADAFDEEALLDEAIDEVLLGGEEDEHSRLARRVGMRRALARATTHLRLAGVRPGRVRDARLADPAKARILCEVLAAYERRLRRGRLADAAGVYRTANGVLRAGGEARGAAGALATQRVYLVPGIERRGLAGQFLAALQHGGAEVLEADPVRGLEVPGSVVWRSARERPGRLSHLHDVEGGAGAAGDVQGASEQAPAADLDIFVANSVEAELREVMRRARERGLRWDEVEIVATDAATYGSALHALAERMGVPVTFATGLPVERTRPGRVAAAYFRWIEGGFHADIVRTLLYANDLAAPRPNHWIRGATLARRLRALRIGWGRERYLPAIEGALAEADGLSARRYESDEQLERRRRRARRELRGLRGLLAPVLRATPPVAAGGDPDALPVSPSRVARGLRRFLGRASPGSSVDDAALERATGILRRIEAVLVRTTDYRAAAAIVRRHLSFPVPAPRAEGSAPWSSAGGALHFTDIRTGGRTGRRATFVVGLDAHRMAGSAAQDPYLLDADRARLTRADLPLSQDRARERRFALAALLARLRGSTCLSYAAWDPAEARAVSPSSDLLQAFRLMRRDASATFDDLAATRRPRAGLVPRRTTRLDSTDVWMASLERDGRLLDGGEAVREAFPRIAAGWRARAALAGDAVTAFHGRIAPRPELDPRRNPELAVSASALATLGACAKRYLHRYVMRVTPPDDPAYDPEGWLDPLGRGRILHRVYERALVEARQGDVEYQDPAFERLVFSILDREVARAAREVPAPSDAVREREMEALAGDAASFVDMIRRDPPRWIDTERAFGLGDDPPLPLRTPTGDVMVRGAIDRVDALPNGVRVVDYKTGGTFAFSGRKGTWDGGRRLQHVVYSAVASRLYDGRAVVMEYHFPTRKGENQRRAYPAGDLTAGPELVSRLLDRIAGGHFLPTDDPGDCRFCDYQAVCRVRVGDFGVQSSPLASWVKERIGEAPELAGLRAIRNWDEEGPGFLHALEADERTPTTPPSTIAPAPPNPGARDS